MRAIVFVVAALCASALAFNYGEQNEKILNFVNQRIYEDKINETIESLKETLNAGDPANGIPSFNPLELAELYLNLTDSELLWTDLMLTDVVVSGLTDFIATHIKFNIVGFKMDLNASWTHINAKANYGGDVELFGFIPLYGHGAFDIDITGLDIGASFKLGTTGGNVSIDNLSVYVNLQDASFSFTGLLDDEPASLLFSALLTDFVPAFIHDRSAWLTATISPIVSDIANSMVEGMTVDDLLDLITGGGESTTAPPAALRVF